MCKTITMLYLFTVYCRTWLLDIKITENKIYRLMLTAAVATRVGWKTRLHKVVFWPLLLHGGMCTLTSTVNLKDSKSNRSDKHSTDKEKRKIHAAQTMTKTGKVIAGLQQEELWEGSMNNCTLDHTDGTQDFKTTQRENRIMMPDCFSPLNTFHRNLRTRWL